MQQEQTTRSTALCKDCGNVIPDQPPMGQCPACLINLAISEPQESTRTATVSAERIGPYQLLEQIGEGGFGVVYHARQIEPIERDVALKLIKPGMDSTPLLARFQGERQTLAALDHPNIAEIFDAGMTNDGRPYLVMELIEGPSILEYCDRFQMNLQDRIRFLISICDAIAHAHSRGVIHRDLKPSNILVAVNHGSAVPKVIDFGIAKALDAAFTFPTQQTLDRQFLGTPSHMSPEQASGLRDIDIRSDVYALGVILFQLICGKSPLERSIKKETPIDQTLMFIRELDPTRPSAALESLPTDGLVETARVRKSSPKELLSKVRGELDWIVVTALANDRERRYPNCQEFARDLSNFLERKVVHARPPTPLYLASRFTRRHRIKIGLSTLAASALLVSSASLLFGMQTAKKQAKIAKSQAAKSAAFADSLEELIFYTNPNGGFRADYTVREMLRDSSDRIRDRFKDFPDAEAHFLTQLGAAFTAHGEYTHAINSFSRAIQLAESESGRNSEEWTIPASLLAHQLEKAQEYESSIELAQQVLDSVRSRFGERHTATVRAKANLAYFRWRSNESDFHSTSKSHSELLGLASQIEKRNDKASKETYMMVLHYLIKLGNSRQQFEQVRDNLTKHRQVMSELGYDGTPASIINKKHLANLHVHLGEYQLAERAYLEAQRDNLVLFDSNSPSAADDLLDLSNLYSIWGRRDKEIEINKRLFEIAEDIRESNPKMYNRIQSLKPIAE